MTTILSPILPPPIRTRNAAEAVAHARMLYDESRGFLRDKLKESAEGVTIDDEVSAFYPYVAVDIRKKKFKIR